MFMIIYIWDCVLKIPLQEKDLHAKIKMLMPLNRAFSSCIKTNILDIVEHKKLGMQVISIPKLSQSQ